MKKKIRLNLTARVFSITVCLLILCCMLTYLFIAWFMPKTYERQIDDFYDDLAMEYADWLNGTTPEEAQAVMSDLLRDLDLWLEYEKEDIKLHILDEAGFEITFPEGTRGEMRQRDFDGIHATTAYPFQMNTDIETCYLLLAIDTEPINQAIEALKETLPWLFLMVLALSLVSACIYSLYLTRPMVKISRISHKLADLDFSELLPVKRSDEIGVISEDLNTLSSRLAAALDELQTTNLKLKDDIEKEQEAEKKRVAFFASASHELKTPITIVKGQLQGMLYKVGSYKDRDTYLARALEVVDRLEKMVQELLIVSRMESPGYQLNIKEFDIRTLIQQRIIEQEDLFIRTETQLETVYEDTSLIAADKNLIGRVIDNLVSNALYYSGKNAALYVHVYQEDDMVCISFENTNAYIEETYIDRLFEAFYRPEQSRSGQAGGSGLGLYLVKTILEQHHAAYKIFNTDRGVQFVFSLKAIEGCSNREE